MGPDAVSKAGLLCPVTSPLRILLPNLLNSGDLVSRFPLCRVPRPLTSSALSRGPEEGEIPAWGPSLLCLPAIPQAPAFCLHTLAC